MIKFRPASDGKFKPGEKAPRQRLFRPIETEYDTDWHTWKFWRNAFLLYWIFSLGGHFLEILWVNRTMLFGLPPTNVLPLFVVAAPYGFGALAIIWCIYPLIKENKANMWVIFILSCVLGGVIEFLCAMVIIAFSPDHVNHYWNYDARPFNIMGQVCLGNCLAFGLAALPGAYWVFPIVNNAINYLDKQNSRLLSIATSVLFVAYMIIQVMVVSGNPPSKVLGLPRPYADPAGICVGKKRCPPEGYPRTDVWMRETRRLDAE